MKVLFRLTAFILCSACLTSCMRPSYTWGYEHAAGPVATAAYIRAVMAHEAGEDELALYYYDKALSREKSDKVQSERDKIKSQLEINNMTQ